ncbi:hypothetical protein [Herbiconiux sp. YIM B11900]|uniref:hypothetical protein n=1 Tax=Herbiconiux sp. YIM B11900 TaxID=3404131 RepID=UPI003F86D2F8
MTGPDKTPDPAKAGKADRDPADPGFWRRPLPSWAVWGLIGLAAVVVIAALVVSLSLGVKLF